MTFRETTRRHLFAAMENKGTEIVHPLLDLACTRPVSSPVKETPGFSPFLEDRIYESVCLPFCSIRTVGMSGFFPGLAYFVTSRPMRTRERHRADSIDVQVREAFLRCRCVRGDTPGAAECPHGARGLPQSIPVPVQGGNGCMFT